MTDISYYESRFNFDKRRNYTWKYIAKDLQKFIDKDSVVLDLGAGYCDFINNVTAKEKWALDIFPDLTKYASSNVKTCIDSVLNPLVNMPDNYFNIIFASNFFEHFSFQDIDIVMKFIKKKLQADGVLILIQPNYRYAYREYFDDYTHKTVFTDISIQDYLESNSFKVIKNIPRYIPFSMKSKLSIGYKLIKLYLLLPIRPFAKQMLVVARKGK